MSTFNVGDPDESHRVVAQLDALCTGGGFAAAVPMAGIEMPPEAVAVQPSGVLHLEVLAVCKCGHGGCNGWSGRGETQIMFGWEAAAAMAGQMSVFIEQLPVDLRDQAERLFADSAAAVRAALAKDDQ